MNIRELEKMRMPKSIESRQEFKYQKMGIFASKEDEENAYRKKEGWFSRSIRRGTDKAIKVLTFGILTGSDPVKELGKDAAEELVSKVIPRSKEKNDDD